MSSPSVIARCRGAVAIRQSRHREGQIVLTICLIQSRRSRTVLRWL